MALENIEDLNYTWEDSVENFFKWLEYICGYSPHSEVYVGLQNRIMNVEELETWIDLFEGDLDNIQNVSERYFAFHAKKDTYNQY